MKSPSGSAILTADSLKAGYLPNVDILNGCSLHVQPGELVAIIGPNGAGKSTLLKTIFGLVLVRSGSIQFRGESVVGLPPHVLVSKGLGCVPQNGNVFSSLTVRENLEMGLYQRMDRWAERFEVICELMPILKRRRKQRVGSMSGGERQMVAFGRALMMEPDVLLLDEPSAGLSPVNQDEILRQVLAIAESGISVLMVEQNARRSLEICDRAYVLEQGRNAHTGTGEQLLSDPKVVELYLGSLVGAGRASENPPQTQTPRTTDEGESPAT